MSGHGSGSTFFQRMAIIRGQIFFELLHSGDFTEMPQIENKRKLLPEDGSVFSMAQL